MTDLDSLWTLPPAPPVEPPTFTAPPPPPPEAPAPDAPPVDARRRPRGVVLAAGAVALALISGGVGGAIGARSADDPPAAPTASPGAATTRIVNNGNGIDVKSVLAKVEPAVVDIQIRGLRGQGEGTGIVVDAAQGLILTNAHVVEANGAITLTTPSDKTARAATILGSDASHDIAVLQTSNTAGLVAAEMGSSSAVEVGEDVVAIGNALGLRGDPSVTRGIISGLGRTIGQLTGMIQTDAAINPGNSGGPLVNAAGQVVGVNTAIAGQAQNIGFAIPIDAAKSILERITGGAPATAVAFLGVSTDDADDGSPGAVVMTIEDGSAAAQAGLRQGDRIISIDGVDVPGPAELRGVIQARKPGDTVKLVAVRDGKEQTFTVTLGERQS